MFWSGVEGHDQTRLVRENRDLLLEIIPSIQYGFNRLQQGELPLWNDRQFCGTPFFANPTHGILQPTNLVFLFVNMPQALALHAFISLALMGFFLVLFIRSLGVRYIPATLGGIVYVCSGAAAAAMSRPAVANALVWMPLLCWIVRLHVHNPRASTLLFGSVALSLLWLSGSPMTALAATGFCGAYALCAVMFDVSNEEETAPQYQRKHFSALTGFILMLFVAFLLTAVQWLPTLYWAGSLADPGAFFGRFTVAGLMPDGVRSLPAQFLQVRSGALPALGYVGISTLLLLPAAFLHHIPRWERAFYYVAFLLFWLIAVVQCAGLPEGFWAALIYPASFSVAVLAGIGADRLFAPRRNSSTPRFWGPLLFVTVILIVLFVLAPAPARGRVIPLSAAMLIFAVIRSRWAGALSGLILILFLFVDLNAASANLYGHPFFDGSTALMLPEKASDLLGNTARDDRTFVSGSPAEGIHANIGMSNGLRLANGYGQPLTQEQQQWWNALSGEDVETDVSFDVSTDSQYAFLLNTMAVRAVIASEDGGLASGLAPGLLLRRTENIGAHVLYENENALSRFSWASSWRVAVDMESALNVLGDKTFDPRRECVVMADTSDISYLIRTVPDGDVVPETTPEQTRIKPVLDAPEKVVVEVENTLPGILVLADTYDSGWRATVAGQRVPILKTNGLFRGIALPAGKHTVTFEYRPLSVIFGAVISGSTLIILLILLFMSFVKDIRNKKVIK